MLQNLSLINTCMNSTTLFSRVAVTFVAGKAFGKTLRTVCFRELVIDKDDIVTLKSAFAVSFIILEQLTTTLISEVHGRSFFANLFS